MKSTGRWLVPSLLVGTMFAVGFCLAPAGERLVAWACPSGEHEASALQGSTTCAVSGCCVADMYTYRQCSASGVTTAYHGVGDFKYYTWTHSGTNWTSLSSCEQSPCDPASYLLAAINGTQFAWGTWFEPDDPECGVPVDPPDSP